MSAILQGCCLLQDTKHWPLLASRTVETQCIDSDSVYICKRLCWPQQKESHLLFEPSHYQTKIVCKMYWLCTHVYAYVQYVHLIVTSVCARTTSIMYLVSCGPCHFSVTFLAGEVLCTDDEMASFAALLCHIQHGYDSQRCVHTHCREYALLLYILSNLWCIFILASDLLIPLYRATIDFYHSIQSRIIPSKCKLKVSLFTCLACL